MSKDGCQNECLQPLNFPLRPGESPQVLHGKNCPCCDPRKRINQDNRPALSHFNYRIGTYGTIREWLFHQINTQKTLRNWTYRSPDDPAIALLEGACELGDILTFYQETYANEAFLRTAKWRESISDLVRMLGYRLSPAVGGNATFAFELKKEEPIVIPAGFPVKATLEEAEKPVDFETTADLTAYPWLSRFNLFRPLDEPNVNDSTQDFYISDSADPDLQIELKSGDRIMVGKSSSTSIASTPDNFENEQFLTIDSVRELHGEKIFKIKGNLKDIGSEPDLAAYKIGRKFHHFGYDSTVKIVDNDSPVTTSATVTESTNPTATTTTSSATIQYKYVPTYRPALPSDTFYESTTLSDTFEYDEFPLDTEADDLPVNAPFIVRARSIYDSGKFTTLIRNITDVATSPLTWGDSSGTVSIVSLKGGAEGDETWGSIYIKDASFYEVTSPLFELKAVNTEKLDVSGTEFNYFGTAQQTRGLKDRKLMIAPTDSDPYIVKVDEIPGSFDPESESNPRLHSIFLSETLDYIDFPNENPVTTVFGNLAEATQGKSLPEVVLGSGDNKSVFQNFKVPKVPLTYHVNAANTPVETPELVVYVDGRLWEKVDSFFGHAKDEQIYIVREDSEGTSWVQFGDGKTGSRLTTGNSNVTGIYRIGSGAFGPLKVDTKVQPSGKIKNLDKIGMPMIASGGSGPESGDNARATAPGKIQSLDRIVSLKDLETEAAAIPGVAVASAAWELSDNVPAAVVTVLMETGRSGEISDVRNTLNSYNNERGTGRHPVLAELGKRKHVAISVQYALDHGFRADLVEPLIRLALGINHGLTIDEESKTGLFSVPQRSFGGNEYASSVEGVTQNVEGVLWSKVVAFTGLSDVDDPGTISIDAPTVLSKTVTCNNKHILSLYDTHLFLTEVKREGS